jgi:hypothetical protein
MKEVPGTAACLIHELEKFLSEASFLFFYFLPWRVATE